MKREAEVRLLCVYLGEIMDLAVAAVQWISFQPYLAHPI
jgi:hypothetical protein